MNQLESIKLEKPLKVSLLFVMIYGPILIFMPHGKSLRGTTPRLWFNPQEAIEAVNYVNLPVKQSFYTPNWFGVRTS